MCTKTNCENVKYLIIMSTVLCVFEWPKLYCEEMELLLQAQKVQVDCSFGPFPMVVEISLKERGLSAAAFWDRNGHKPGSSQNEP